MRSGPQDAITVPAQVPGGGLLKGPSSVRPAAPPLTYAVRGSRVGCVAPVFLCIRCDKVRRSGGSPEVRGPALRVLWCRSMGKRPDRPSYFVHALRLTARRGQLCAAALWRLILAASLVGGCWELPLQ